MRAAAEALVAIVIGFLAVFCCAAEAAEIRVNSNPAIKSFLEKTAPVFEAKTGHKLLRQYGLLPTLKTTIDAEAFDVVISAGVTHNYLVAQNKLGSFHLDLGRVCIGVGVGSGTSKPDISNVDVFKQAVLKAKSISIPPRESFAGSHMLRVFERLGVTNDVMPKLQITDTGSRTPGQVAAGNAELGITLMSEFALVAGVEIVGPLPSEIQNCLVQAAYVGPSPRERPAAEALVAFLGSAENIPLIKAEGLEPIPR